MSEYSCGKYHVGDKGQRFEVSFFDPVTNSRKIFGWSNDLDGADAMCQSIEAHPVWTLAMIVDKETIVEPS